MIPGIRVHQPRSLSETVALLDEHSDDVALLAGGTELVLLMRLGLTQLSHLVSLRRVPGLGEIATSENGDLVLGAGVTHQQVADSGLVRRYSPAFAHAEGRLANLRVRTSGTLAGNLAFADPHSDTLPLLIALDATVECTGPDGRRTVPAADFVLGPFYTDLRDGEVLTRIVVPEAGLGRALAHERFESTKQRPMATVSCSARIGAGGRLTGARLIIGSVCPRPQVVPLSPILEGVTPEELDVEAVDAVAAAAVEALDLRDNEEGSADYRSSLVAALSARAVRAMASEATARKAARMPG